METSWLVGSPPVGSTVGNGLLGKQVLLQQGRHVQGAAGQQQLCLRGVMGTRALAGFDPMFRLSQCSHSPVPVEAP